MLAAAIDASIEAADRRGLIKPTSCDLSVAAARAYRWSLTQKGQGNQGGCDPSATAGGGTNSCNSAFLVKEGEVPLLRRCTSGDARGALLMRGNVGFHVKWLVVFDLALRWGAPSSVHPRTA